MRRSRIIIAAVFVGVVLGAGVMFGVLTLLDDDEEQSEEARIKATVERVYDLISAKNYGALWSMYTSGFRERCSMEAMVQYFEDSRREGVRSLRVSGFEDIDFVADRARVSYSVVGFDDAGRETANYDYDVVLLRENNRWLFEEACFAP